MKKVSKTLRKLLVIIMIILLLNNFVIITTVKADLVESAVEGAKEAANDTIGENGQGFFLSFIGLLTLPARAIVLGLGYAVNSLTAAVAYIEGATDVEIDTKTITPFDIFFNKVKILDVNFFEIGSTVNIVNTIRTGIASWYYALRLIAISILLVILIYVGIRMAISTIATDRAMYKKMLYDWVVSLVLIFLINYIIIFVITVNNTIVEAIEKATNAEAVSDTYDTIRNLGFKWVDIDSIPATVIYVMLVVQTLGLVISYFNRMLKVAFLIIISPLITLTYAVDKMGDGKAQALNNWLKEFIFTVITQIFHCIIYMSMINVSFNLLIERGGKGVRHALTSAVMAILCVNFVKTAEELVRKILMKNHNDSSLSVAGGMAATAVALQKSKSLGKATRTAVNVTKQNLKTAGNVLKSTPKALGTVAKAPLKGISAIKNNIKAERAWHNEGKSQMGAPSKKDDKVTYKAQKGAYKAAMKKQIQQEKNKNKQKKYKKKTAKREKRNNGIYKKPVIKQAVGIARTAKNAGRTIKGYKNKLSRIATESSSLQFIGKVAKGYAAVSMGAFTGSMMYGATGDVMKSGAMAVAGYNMHRGFQQSAGTIENRAIANLYGAGARTEEEALGKLNVIASHPENFDGKSSESVKMANDLLKAIGDELIAAGINPQWKTKIKNEIDRAALATPQNMPQAISNILNQIPIAKGQEGGLSENRELVNACNAYSEFANMKQVYSQMVTGQELGISMDAFVQDCTERFVPLSSGQDSIETVSESEERLRNLYLESETQMNADIAVMTNEVLDETIEDLFERRQELEEMLNTDEIDAYLKEQYEQELRELERVEDAMEESIIRDKDRALSESQEKLMKEAKKRYENDINDLLKELGITTVTSKDSYYVVARKQAGISEKDLKEADSIDDIIAEREKFLAGKRSGEIKTRKTEEQLQTSIRNAKLFKQVTDLKNKNQAINMRIAKK